MRKKTKFGRIDFRTAVLNPNYSTTRIFEEEKIPRPVIEKLRKCSSFEGPPQG